MSEEITYEDLGPPTCPECGCTTIVFDLTCHTWQGHGDVWMACQRCDSALEYSCNECDWRFVHGLNSGNPRSAKNEAARPPWLTTPAPLCTSKFALNIPYPGTKWWEEVP